MLALLHVFVFHKYSAESKERIFHCGHKGPFPMGRAWTEVMKAKKSWGPKASDRNVFSTRKKKE